MGATGVYMSMADTKKMILRDYSYNTDKGMSTVLKSRNGKGGMWILRKIHLYHGDEVKKSFLTIDFIVMSHKNGETVYREYNVDSGPCYYDCPIEWLDLITVESKFGIDWMNKVKRIHNLKIVPNTKFKFSQKEFETLYPLTNKFWAVKNLLENKVYKMDKELIMNILLEVE